MNLDKTLQKASNAIISNISNTEEIGLVNGKMSLCLFMYRMYLNAPKRIYMDMAYMLFNDIISQLKATTMASSISQMAEVGVGFWELYDSGFFTSENVSGIVQQIDKIILERPYFLQSSDKKRIRLDIFFQGIYLLKRMQHKNFCLIDESIRTFSYKVDNYISRQDETILLRSILYWDVVQYVFEQLLKLFSDNQHIIHILEMSNVILQNVDLKETLRYEDDCWLSFLLCQTVFPELQMPKRYSLNDICKMIDEKIKDLYYNKFIANSELSILSNYLIIKTQTYEK